MSTTLLAWPKPPQHNHLTRDVKARGRCPGCDYRREARASIQVVADAFGVAVQVLRTRPPSWRGQVKRHRR